MSSLRADLLRKKYLFSDIQKNVRALELALPSERHSKRSLIPSFEEYFYPGRLDEAGRKEENQVYPGILKYKTMEKEIVLLND